MKFVGKLLAVIDRVTLFICLLVMVGFVGVAISGAAGHVLRVTHRIWREAGTEETIIWSIVAFCSIWVVLRWKRLNKRG